VYLAIPSFAHSLVQGLPVGACLGLRAIVQAVNPSLARMPQLGEPMLMLLHAAVAVVCIALLTTLTRVRAANRPSPSA
jgi:hypothetical protein